MYVLRNRASAGGKRLRWEESRQWIKARLIRGIEVRMSSLAITRRRLRAFRLCASARSGEPASKLEKVKRESPPTYKHAAVIPAGDRRRAASRSQDEVGVDGAAKEVRRSVSSPIWCVRSCRAAMCGKNEPAGRAPIARPRSRYEVNVVRSTANKVVEFPKAHFMFAGGKWQSP
jgi:hypothetical protein